MHTPQPLVEVCDWQGPPSEDSDGTEGSRRGGRDTGLAGLLRALSGIGLCVLRLGALLLLTWQAGNLEQPQPHAPPGGAADGSCQPEEIKTDAGRQS